MKTITNRMNAIAGSKAFIRIKNSKFIAVCAFLLTLMIQNLLPAAGDMLRHGSSLSMLFKSIFSSFRSLLLVLLITTFMVSSCSHRSANHRSYKNHTSCNHF
jgi:hypothetical protein